MGESTISMFEDQDRKNRGRMEIIAAILSVAKKGAGKTQIMYRANLSFKQLQKYMDFLMKKDLLSVYDGDRGSLYETTSRGCEFLQDYKKIKNVLSESV